MTVNADAAGGVQEYAGEVRARIESRLGLRVAGKLVARPAEVGQRVRSGQALARLDPAELALQQDPSQAPLPPPHAAYPFPVRDLHPLPLYPSSAADEYVGHTSG